MGYYIDLCFPNKVHFATYLTGVLPRIGDTIIHQKQKMKVKDIFYEIPTIPQKTMNVDVVVILMEGE